MPQAPQNNNKQNTKHSNAAMQKINEQNKNQNKSQKKVNHRRGYQQRPTLNQSQMFYAALTCPFDPNVLGVQVPDPFPYPTQVYHVHQTTVIGNAANNSGSGAIAFLPNPVLSLIDITQANVGNITGSCIKATPFTRYGPLTPTNVSNAILGAITPTALSDVFADYRVVSWGIKISNLMPELVATGRVIIAQIPLGDTIPSYPNLASAIQPVTLESIFGIDPVFLGSSNILELPTGFQLTAQDFLHGDLECGGMYSAADFWDFKTTRDIGKLNVGGSPGTIFTGDDVAVTTSGLNYGIGYKDMTRCRGGSAIVIYFEGMPSNQIENFFQVETIYHLEGTPNFSSISNNALISSTARKTAVGTTQNVEQVMAKASKVENVFTWIDRGADFLNKNKSTIMKVGAAAMAFL
ncbi:hypothetical protein [Hubei narna-like virus 9]|uniref:hypothetical protein n=1 Tax=Hubei narna-like virus 9 TaxID=1922962 RepID=UPI00090BBAC1|nr:hypothetical protein [Hubei narna-like virus 9]APG77207.1 hypothetical protein [Hubei narna-like virus 9]